MILITFEKGEFRAGETRSAPEASVDPQSRDAAWTELRANCSHGVPHARALWKSGDLTWPISPLLCCRRSFSVFWGQRLKGNGAVIQDVEETSVCLWICSYLIYGPYPQLLNCISAIDDLYQLTICPEICPSTDFSALEPGFINRQTDIFYFFSSK